MNVMHFLVGAFVVFLLWENPVTRVLLLTAVAALLAFALCPPVVAVVIVAVVTVGLWAGALEEMRARRQCVAELGKVRKCGPATADHDEDFGRGVLRVTSAARRR